MPEYTEDALDDLVQLGRVPADRITRKVEEYCRAQKPLAFAKRLQGDLRVFYRFRIGSYRVIFQHVAGGAVQDLRVVRVGSRKDVY